MPRVSKDTAQAQFSYTAGRSTTTWGNWLVILTKAEGVCNGIGHDPVILP